MLNALRPDDPSSRALPPADGESARLAYVVLGLSAVLEGFSLRRKFTV